MPSARRSCRLASGGSLLAAASVLTLVAACAGGSGPGDGGDEPATDGRSGLAAYAECMSENGVTLRMPSGMPSRSSFPRRSGEPGARPSRAPDGGDPAGGMRGVLGRPAGVDDATWDRAQEACRSLLPSAGPGDGLRDNPALTAYRNCLSDHGVTLEGRPQDLDTTDPVIAAAAKACAPLRPTSRPTVAPSPAN